MGNHLEDAGSKGDGTVTIFEELKAKLAAAGTGTPEQSVAAAIAVYKQAGDLQSMAETYRKQAKAMISDVMAETGSTDYKTAEGRAYVTSPSQRVSYDAKALDVLCTASPDIADLLWPHRKESEVAGTLTIK